MKSKALILAAGTLFLVAAGIAGYVSVRVGTEQPLELAPRMALPPPLGGESPPRLNVEVNRQEILQIFPPEVSVVPPPSPPAANVRESGRSDRDFLEAVTSRWVYVGYANVGGMPTGKFKYNDTPRMEESFEVRQGDAREGVTVYYLDNSKAMARHRSATIRLPLIDALEIPISEQPHLVYTEFVPDPTLAFKRYWELYGKRHKELSKRYVPAPGEHLPPTEPLSKEEVKQRVDSYLEFVAQRLADRKPHPRYQDSQPSLDEMRKRLYEQYDIQVNQEVPPQGDLESGEIVPGEGESPGEGP